MGLACAREGFLGSLGGWEWLLLFYFVLFFFFSSFGYSSSRPLELRFLRGLYPQPKAFVLKWSLKDVKGLKPGFSNPGRHTAETNYPAPLTQAENLQEFRTENLTWFRVSRCHTVQSLFLGMMASPFLCKRAGPVRRTASESAF